MNGWTDERTDGRTDGRMDERTPRPSTPGGPTLHCLAAAALVALLTTSSLDGRLKCKSVFQLVGGACQHVSFLSEAAAEVEEQEEEEEE